MRLILAVLAIALGVSFGGRRAAAESPTLGRIRAEGVVRCGGAIRPGLAFPGEDHAWYGLEVDVCRAIAAAVLGNADRIEFHGYGQRPAFGRIVGGALPHDDVAFLTASELFGNELLGAVLPGPAVYQQTVSIMVWDTTAVRHVGELGPIMVCGEPGTTADNALHAYADARQWTATLSPWMELEEMMDAFAVGRCPAVVGETTALAALRIGAALQGHPGRLLPEAIATYPVMAATPIDDPRWSVVVGWVVQTVLSSGGPQPLDIPGAPLGLDRDWQARVRALGSYAALHRHALGDESPLGLLPGANDSWSNGGLIAPPSIE